GLGECCGMALAELLKGREEAGPSRAQRSRARQRLLPGAAEQLAKRRKVHGHAALDDRRTPDTLDRISNRTTGGDRGQPGERQTEEDREETETVRTAARPRRLPPEGGTRASECRGREDARREEAAFHRGAEGTSREESG